MSVFSLQTAVTQQMSTTVGLPVKTPAGGNVFGLHTYIFVDLISSSSIDTLNNKQTLFFLTEMLKPIAFPLNVKCFLFIKSFKKKKCRVVCRELGRKERESLQKMAEIAKEGFLLKQQLIQEAKRGLEDKKV